MLSTDYSNLTQNLKAIDDVFHEAVEEAVSATLFDEIFGFKMTDMQNITHQMEHGMGGIAYTPENQDYPEAQDEQGGKVTYTNHKYALGIALTYATRRYINSNPHKFDAFLGKIASVTDEAFHKVDTSCANLLTDGFATSHTDVWGKTFSGIGADGKALFASDHWKHTGDSSKGTFSNIITDTAGTANPALDSAALNGAIRTGRLYTDAQGVKRGINFDTLLVPPTLEATAMQLIQSKYLPWSANNDINPLFNKFKVRVWNKLSTKADGSTSTAAYRYIYDSKKVKESLKGYWVDQPAILQPETYPDNDNWKYKFKMIYSRGFGFAPYVMASQWTA